MVELRPPAEILATLDDEGRLEGLPFMPEMLAYFGRRHRVGARVERACDTISGPSVRRIPDTVLLDDLRCDGFAHGGCQAGCRIYWKEAWLQPVDETAPMTGETWNADDLERLTQRVSTVTAANSGRVTFRCQATEMPKASVAVTRRETPRSFIEELRSSNVKPARFARIVGRTWAEALAKRSHLMSRGLFMPYDPARRERPAEVEPLQPGQLVRIRSKDEIARTLGRDGKNKGLWFDREMLPFCGRTARVLRRIERFVDEHTGELIELKNDCYVLDGIICTGDRSAGRRFCPRGIYPYWRSCWLEPIADAAAVDASETASEGAPSSPVAA